MAKQKKTLPARKLGDRSRDEESLLLRSAESLGRVIGSLQRQLDGATKRLSTTASDAGESIPSLPEGVKATRRGTKKRSASPKRAAAKKTNSAVKTTRKTAAPKTRQR